MTGRFEEKTGLPIRGWVCLLVIIVFTLLGGYATFLKIMPTTPSYHPMSSNQACMSVTPPDIQDVTFLDADADGFCDVGNVSVRVDAVYWDANDDGMTIRMIVRNDSGIPQKIGNIMPKISTYTYEEGIIRKATTSDVARELPECKKINDGQSELYVDSGGEFAWYAFAKKHALDAYSEEEQIDGTLVIAFTNWDDTADDTATTALVLNDFKRCNPSYIRKMLQDDGSSV